MTRADTHADQGIIRDEKGQEQPADKQRAQSAHQTRPDDSVTREATRLPKKDASNGTRGSGT